MASITSTFLIIEPYHGIYSIIIFYFWGKIIRRLIPLLFILHWPIVEARNRSFIETCLRALSIHWDSKANPNENSLKAIRSFYDATSGRFIDPSTKVTWPVLGRAYDQDDYVKIEIPGGNAWLFHQLSDTDSRNVEVAVIGVSIVEVHTLRARAQNNNFTQIWTLLEAELKRMGVPANRLISEIPGNQETHIIFGYMPGPSFSQLHDLFLDGEISARAYTSAIAKYSALALKLAEIAEQNPKLITNAREFAATNARYFKGDWTISGI